jgi:hypothetical protein
MFNDATERDNRAPSFRHSTELDMGQVRGQTASKCLPLLPNVGTIGWYGINFHVIKYNENVEHNENQHLRQKGEVGKF